MARDRQSMERNAVRQGGGYAHATSKNYVVPSALSKLGKQVSDMFETPVKAKAKEPAELEESVKTRSAAQKYFAARASPRQTRQSTAGLPKPNQLTKSGHKRQQRRFVNSSLGDE